MTQVENLIKAGSATEKQRENYWTFEVNIVSIWISTLILSLILFSLIKMQAAQCPSTNDSDELNSSVSSFQSEIQNDNFIT